MPCLILLHFKKKKPFGEDSRRVKAQEKWHFNVYQQIINNLKEDPHPVCTLVTPLPHLRCPTAGVGSPCHRPTAAPSGRSPPRWLRGSAGRRSGARSAWWWRSCPRRGPRWPALWRGAPAAACCSPAHGSTDKQTNKQSFGQRRGSLSEVPK